MIFKVRYNIIEGNVFAQFDVAETEDAKLIPRGVLVMPVVEFREFRGMIERGADHAPIQDNVVTFKPDSTIRAAWPT